MLWVDPEYRAVLDPRTIFDDMRAVDGEVFRQGKGRITLRFRLNGHHLFIKRHTGVGWWEIIKELLQGRWPVTSAINEWRALERLEILNISSLTPVAFGKTGWNPARLYSFLVTRELENTISLEDVVKDWQKRRDFIHIKRALIHQVARLARRMHNNGLNHRDMYICHIHVSRDWLETPIGEPELSIIDLHRAQIRQSVPERWRVKDVASLYFSSMNTGLTHRDRMRFIKAYRQCKLAETLKNENQFWDDVQQRADRLYATRPGIEQESGSE